jgi:hypothetical protein
MVVGGMEASGVLIACARVVNKGLSGGRFRVWRSSRCVVIVCSLVS